MGTPFHQLNARTQELIQRQGLLQAKKAGIPTINMKLVAQFDAQMREPSKKRIQQHQGDGMNRWEREYRASILARWPDCFLHREVALPLANGVKYKLDFLRVLITDDGCHCLGFEVKGQARSTGIVKIKVAAQAYPWITFRLVTKRRKKDGGGWSEETVLP